MCINSSELIPRNSFCQRLRPSKPLNIRVRRLNRWRRLRKGLPGTKKKINVVKNDMIRDMQMKNLKLYMENQSIIEENEKLRKKALFLHQENQSLLAQLQKRSPLLTNPQINHL